MFFKVLIPLIAVSLLSVLAGTLEANDRLLVVSVSVLVTLALALALALPL